MLEQFSELACGAKCRGDEHQSIEGDLPIGLEPLDSRLGNTRHLRQGLAGEVLCESRLPGVGTDLLGQFARGEQGMSQGQG
ncbi:hypothetical protein FQZ97_663760 [compost metagenome]